ncbi:MAG: lysophospholipid acyltransferase family protein [Sphingobium sp.]
MSVAGRCRLWLRLGALVGLLLACVPVHLATRLTFRASGWPRRFLKAAGWLCGVRVTVRGTPLSGNVFFAANHVSWLDILTLAGETGCAFISRDDVAHWPLIGWLAAQNHTILVSRTERGAVRGQVDVVREALMRPQPVALFPEGTTGDGRTLLPFKPALFTALTPPPRPLRVQPVLIDYGAATGDVAWIDEEPGGANAARILARRRTPVVLHFLEPCDPVEFADRKLLTAVVRGRIEAAMVQAG